MIYIYGIKFCNYLSCFTKKSKIKYYIRLFMSTLTLFAPGHLIAEEIKIAVASNFKFAMISLISGFETSSDHTVTLIVGSTGKHYAQINNGAPYDIFFAADIHRPKLLEEEGVALPGTRFTYALGKIVLWSSKSGYIDPDARILNSNKFRFLAIANPRLAPYGMAAKEVLLKLNLWKKLQKKIVRGENVGQTFQFIESGNAELGFVAYSQLISSKRELKGSHWKIPQTLYTPIKQQAVILKNSKATSEFISYVRSKAALKIIRDSGYDTP